MRMDASGETRDRTHCAQEFREAENDNPCLQDFSAPCDRSAPKRPSQHERVAKEGAHRAGLALADGHRTHDERQPSHPSRRRHALDRGALRALARRRLARLSGRAGRSPLLASRRRAPLQRPAVPGRRASRGYGTGRCRLCAGRFALRRCRRLRSLHHRLYDCRRRAAGDERRADPHLLALAEPAFGEPLSLDEGIDGIVLVGGELAARLRAERAINIACHRVMLASSTIRGSGRCEGLTHAIRRTGTTAGAAAAAAASAAKRAARAAFFCRSCSKNCCDTTI
eukprot:1786280-Prymnesium_polylepis.1